MAKPKESAGEELCKAAREGSLKAVQQLLGQFDFKQDKQALDRALRASLFGRRKLEVTDCLLHAGANPNQVTSVGTLLMCAAMNGDLPLVKRLVEAGADFKREVKRETALSAALSYYQKPVVEYLEKLGAPSIPSTTLLYASMHGDIERARRAIASGAGLENVGGTFEETPLMAASRKGQVEAVKLLLQHGANPNKRVKGSTAIFDAVEHGKSAELLEAMLTAGADIHVKEYDKTVLMAACSGGVVSIVKRLVELGADIHAKDKHHNKTALDCARTTKNKELISYLESLDMVADRDQPRALARALARKFGGRPIEHSMGFLLNSRFNGTKCQFSIASDEFSLFVHGLDFSEPEFKRCKDGQVLFSVAKPDFQRQKFELVKAASAAEAKYRVFRTLGLNPLPVNLVTKFYRKHEKHIRQMELGEGEVVRLGGNFAGFRCAITQLRQVEQRLEAFARLIQTISRPPQPERTLFEREWLLKPAANSGIAGKGKHKFGGQLAQPVGCVQCKGATNLMAELDLSDPALPKTPLGRGRLPVFWCLNCLEWDAVFFRNSGSIVQPLNNSGKPVQLRKLATGEEDLPERRITLLPVPPGKKAGRKSKLGGTPTWIQMEQTPDCPQCEKPMAFVLQLASDSRISYGDVGMLYAFACPECKVGASLIQSH